MAISKSKSVCSDCISRDCTNCDISIKLADNLITFEQARKFAREGNIRAEERLNAPKERFFVPFYVGRKNGYSQECACCRTIVEKNQGHLAKTSSDDSNWYVLCKKCKKSGGTIRIEESPAQEAYTPPRIPEVYGDIIKAGESFWESTKHPENHGTVANFEAIPHASPDFLQELLQSMVANMQEVMWMQTHPIVIADPKSVRPGASLDELYLGAKYNGVSFHGPQKKPHTPWDGPPDQSPASAPPGWKRVESIKPWPDRMFGPVKTKKRVHYSASAPGFRWADGPSPCSERDSMLGAVWGELPASTQRKHKTKRPKRIGW